MVVEGAVVVERDGEVIEGGDGGGGYRWRQRRRGKGGGTEVEAKQKQCGCGGEEYRGSIAVLRLQFLGAGWWLGSSVACGGWIIFLEEPTYVVKIRL